MSGRIGWLGEDAVVNTIDMSGIFLMTAPNMSGKSTLMRSAATTALLSVCGLCAPLSQNSCIRRFDHLFVRGASADVPTEEKSAFGAEMGDVAAMLRCCGDKSLVFVDELGRGTSPRDGTRLAAAVLEAMATAGMKGIFATHLHDILDLPLQGMERIVPKRMAMHDRDETGLESHSYRWTYRLEDGVYRDSMALMTAARFGLPESILARAETLGEYLPDKISHTGENVEPAAAHDSSECGLADLTQTVREIAGVETVSIPPLWSPPSYLEGRSCVYLLELAEDPPRFYVGETDSLTKRLSQHRAKGDPWKRAKSLVFEAPDKSHARDWESHLIRKLAQNGVDLISVRDGRRK